MKRRSLLRGALFGLMMPLMPVVDRLAAERQEAKTEQELLNKWYRAILDNAHLAPTGTEISLLMQRGSTAQFFQVADGDF